MNDSLRIVVVAPELADLPPDDEHALELAQRSRALRIGLLESGYNLIATLPADMYLPERLAQLQPDMVIVDAESEARDVLEHVVTATRDEPRAIVMFTNDDDTQLAREAVAAACPPTSWQDSRPSASVQFWKWPLPALSTSKLCAAN